MGKPNKPNKWDFLISSMIILAMFTWMVIWIATGAWWTVFMILPTVLLLVVVVSLLANRAEGFINTGRRAQ